MVERDGILTIMQRLSTLWQIVNAASSVKDLTQLTRTYHFAVTGPITCYLRAENGTVSVIRWNRPIIEITARLQGPFGWRIAAEQDEAGVYIAAKRRAVIGGLSRARFQLRVPHDVYLVLNLYGCALHLEDVNSTLHVRPQDGTVTHIEPD